MRKEDIRTFREFYPNPSMRHQVHYAFAHHFLPEYVQQNPYAFFSYLYRPDMAMEPTRFIHSRWHAIFEPGAGLVTQESVNPLTPGNVFRRVSDLSMSIQTLVGKPTALVQMPLPEQPVEAFFVGVALLATVERPEIWTRDVQARVFTLEAVDQERPEQGKTGVVCEWTKERHHRNFGFVIPAHSDLFLRSMEELLQAPGAPSSAGFTPPKDGAPS